MCTCSHNSDEHGGADLSVKHTHVAGRCTKCECEAFTTPGSMRVMYHRRCVCGYDWKAPSEQGRCPKCRSELVKTLGMQNNGLKRV